MKNTIVALILLLAASFANAANIPMEILNIKPAGSGTPAIPSTNRIFRAYPGIEYNIRPAILGGLYPFQFALTGAPPGMTIDSATGEITWVNPQNNSGTITLSVTDAEGTTVTTTWAITVSTAGFYFLDSTASPGGDGSIANPFNSFASMIAATGISHVNDIVYFRAGTHTVTQTGTDVGGDNLPEMRNYDTYPFTWLAYPGETVNINGNNIKIRSYHTYLDGINFSGFVNNAVGGQGNTHYNTIRRCTFTNLTASSATNYNQGFIYWAEGDHINLGNFNTIQDNDFSNFTGAAAIGSLYDLDKAVVEDNYVHNDGTQGLTGINVGLALKHGIKSISVRHNKIVMDNGSPFGVNMNSQLADSPGPIDISFNLFKITNHNAYNSNAAHRFNGYGYGFATPTFPEDTLVDGLYYRSTFNMYYYRNTTIGHIDFLYLDGNHCGISGPFKVYNNVLDNDNTSNNTPTDSANFTVNNFIAYGTGSVNTPSNCITDTNNLKVLPTDNAVDANGLLTNAAYVGTYGWEVGTPTEEDHTAPTTTISPNGNRSNTAFTVTIACVDNVGCASTRYCLGSNNCTPASSYTTTLTVKPGNWLCSKGTDAAGNAESPHCAYFGWLTGCK